MEFFNNHKKLFGTALLLFVFLTIIVAILPAMQNERKNKLLPGAEPLTADAAKGKELFIANGCVACHTQQVRNVEMDKTWGSRPSIAADYAGSRRTDVWRNTATLMGTERTGPDLTTIGTRQPSAEWQLTHLYNPRILVEASVMPAYPWLFTVKPQPGMGEVAVSVPEGYVAKGQKVIATREALQLVAYLASLKQTTLPDGAATPEFLYKRTVKAEGGAATAELDGEALYVANCQACHQPNGEGLPGAFPPLKGSKIVLDDNVELMISIIMNGYEGRIKEGYGPMPAVGVNNQLTPEEVTAIMNHEKSSWGNGAKKVDLEQVKKVLSTLKAPEQP
ncbi:cytochrome c oxidase cbb3-type subunit 2 [Filimonas zeae]|uniref:Cytochrome-c oxidase n=1 Tax=Filimonas zeae TaxID=1737353 RepID=A0A917INK6_9BACT|nr:cbb3-type cytochrome c oxidase subunit II [Filimonas zeae]MDR6337460.1 cytochrome c oxidase cbb3-type subunit 2 [Filimonas zeae]GGH58728.1 cytochrome-c oxidase [Filimonas zeae]